MTTTTENMTACLGCGTLIPIDAAFWCDGRCYQCQCEAHATGEIDMDYTEGFTDDRIDESDYADEGMTEDDIAVREGLACYLSDSPAWQHARECDRLRTGAPALLTINSACDWDIPF